MVCGREKYVEFFIPSQRHKAAAAVHILFIAFADGQEGGEEKRRALLVCEKRRFLLLFPPPSPRAPVAAAAACEPSREKNATNKFSISRVPCGNLQLIFHSSALPQRL
jgi:hypothetical protein